MQAKVSMGINSGKSEGKEATVNTMIIIIPSVIGLLVIAVISFVLILYRRRKYKKHEALPLDDVTSTSRLHPPDKKETLKTPKEPSPSVENATEAEMISTQRLLQPDKKMLETADISYKKAPNTYVKTPEAEMISTQRLLQPDKKMLETADISYKKASSLSEENETGNNSPDVIPLSLDSLNVRYISNLSGRKEYIVCKDPTKKSMTDLVFWRLVWQEGCSIIVKLSEAIGETSEKRYWPEKGKECIYGDVLVINEGVLFFEDYRRRKFTITKETEPRGVEQMQFIKWPTKKNPEDVESLINFHHEVKKIRMTFPGPLLVSCSDGFSQSCVFIAMDILLAELEKKDHGDIGPILIKLKEKGLITITEHNNFLRRIWEMFSRQTSTKEDSSAPPNKALFSVSNSTAV